MLAATATVPVGVNEGTYVCADAGLLVTLQTRYFLLIGPVCVTSTFNPENNQV